MKLYGRKLRNLEDLRREKRVLEYAQKHTATNPIVNLDNLASSMGAKRHNTAESGLFDVSMFNSVFNALGSKSLVNALVALAPSLIGLLNRSKRKSSGTGGRSPLEGIVKDVLFGYAKWKAIQFAYRTIRSFWSNSKKSAHSDSRI